MEHHAERARSLIEDFLKATPAPGTPEEEPRGGAEGGPA